MLETSSKLKIGFRSSTCTLITVETAVLGKFTHCNDKITGKQKAEMLMPLRPYQNQNIATSTHISVAKASHMAKCNINEVQKYTPLSTGSH